MRIFISYRREDSGGYAGRLYDRLSARFGAENTFMDVSAIEPGQDFTEVIRKEVASCDALIALIGPRWLQITDDQGRRRLDNPNDFLRIEVTTALERGIRVIPALIRGTKMPRANDLPEALKGLAQRQALDLSDSRFHHDVDRLISALESLTPIQPESQQMGMAEVQIPTPKPSADRPRRSIGLAGFLNNPFVWIAAILGTLTVTAIAIFSFRDGNTPGVSPTESGPTVFATNTSSRAPTTTVPTEPSTPSATQPPSPPATGLQWVIVDDRAVIDPEGKHWEKYQADSGVPGLYLRTDNIQSFGDFLELKADKTFVLEESGAERTGTWEFEGDQVLLTFP